MGHGSGQARQLLTVFTRLTLAHTLQQVVDLVQFMALDNPTKTPARSSKTVAKWRLVWSQQAPDASPLQKFGSKQVRGADAGRCCLRQCCRRV